jgi:single-stranded-DNA-specific exonuclease
MLDTVPIDVDYVIIPDAGSIQFDEQEELSRKGYKVLIIDHHNVSNPPKLENVVLVNNQLSPDFSNKALSGAGMVYKVIQAFNKTYENEFPLVYEKYADLAALGIISDMMDTRTLDNNYIINKGLKNITNPMLRALLEKQAYSVSDIDQPNKIDIAFYIAPLINAVIRFGTAEEKETLFKGFIETNVTTIVETEYRGEVRRENFYDFVARTSANVRGRQNREKEKSLDFLAKKVEETGADKNQLLVVIVSRDDEVTVPHTITGLVAMELLKKYKKPTLVLRPKSDGKGGTLYAGSGRGKANGDFDSLFGMLRESALCEYVEGHDMAHGVAVSHDNLPKLIDYSNEYLKNVEFDVDEIEVDYIFGNSNINYQMLYDFGSAIDIYGNGIPQPKFGFNLRVSKDAVSVIGKKGDTFKINLNGITFIKFNAANILDKMEEANSHLFEFKFVGRAQINE